MTKTGDTSPIVLDNVCVIIPVIGDHQALELLLSDLSVAKFGQIIVSCGDESNYPFLEETLVSLLRTPRGRGKQIAEATLHSECEWLWVLHADVRISHNALGGLQDALATVSWGGFKVALNSTSFCLKVIAAMMNWRSRITSIYTGDQGMFFKRELLLQIDGFPDIELMEDIECSRRLKRVIRGVQLDEKLLVSARKWQQEGIIATMMRMWWFRLRFFFRADPSKLAKSYYQADKKASSVH